MIFVNTKLELSISFLDALMLADSRHDNTSKSNLLLIRTLKASMRLIKVFSPGLRSCDEFPCTSEASYFLH